MVHALPLLGDEPRIDAVLVERLNELPLHVADLRERESPGTLNGLPVLVHVPDGFRIELVDVPGTDAVLLDVGPHRRLDVSDDECDLDGVGEHRLAHLASHHSRMTAFMTSAG